MTCGGVAAVSAGAELEDGGVAAVWAGAEMDVRADAGCCLVADGSGEAGLDGAWPSRTGPKPASRNEAHTNLALILIAISESA